jgi:alpha-tubulin suppressor-like RCC1 family protein
VSSSLAVSAAALTFAQVSAGGEHACGVTTDGKAWCWGANQFGELGIPPEDSPDPCSSQPCSYRPVAVSSGLRFRRVSAGGQFTCGLTTAQQIFCWGRNDAGQLGTGSTASAVSTPGQVAGNRVYRDVRAAKVGNQACAITIARTAFCWGSGRLGNGRSFSRTPVRVSGEQAWGHLTVGTGFACGITTAGQTWCWGVNNRGQLGNGTRVASGTPMQSAAGFTVAQIEAGSSHICAVLVDARAFCWGDGVGVGDGRGPGRRLTPSRIAGNRSWDNVSAGAATGCGVTLTGRGFCWGQGVNGDLGNGSTADRFTPTAVSGGLTFVAIKASFAFSCGWTPGGAAWCWGDNGNGQLGDGTGINRLVPSQVVAPAP